MFENIVIGINGREGGRDALKLATELADPQARFTLVNVYGEASECLPGSASLLLDDQREIADTVLAQTRDQNLPAAEVACLDDSSVGRGLHRIVEQRHGDLVVVGSCHHGPVGKVLMGDDTRSAFNSVPCAIAIAPRAFAERDQTIRSIAIGYDGRPESQVALAAARDIAARTRASITATWVVTLEDVQSRAPLPADWEHETVRLVAECQEHLDQIEGITGYAVYGGPREELSKISHTHDLLIVGSRGHGPWGRVFHSSISSYLERHCGCALLVMPRQTAAKSQAPTPNRESQAPVTA